MGRQPCAAGLARAEIQETARNSLPLELPRGSGNRLDLTPEAVRFSTLEVLNNVTFVGVANPQPCWMEPPDGWGKGIGLPRTQHRNPPPHTHTPPVRQRCTHRAQGRPSCEPVTPGRLFTKGCHTRKQTGRVTEGKGFL